MNAQEEYQHWLQQPDLPQALRQELTDIEGNQAQIEERFGSTLHFGTGGMRGILGAGPNRMNIYTVKRTSLALALFVLHQGDEAARQGIAIGYDSRHMSKEFAEVAGLTIAAAGVRAFLSPYLCPTPEVSFSVRHLGAAAGVMITASHNPPLYNGYKAYGPDGAQLLPDKTAEVRKFALAHPDLFSIPALELDEALQSGMLEWISKDVRTLYINAVVEAVKVPSVATTARSELSIVYTPLFGTGNVPVQDALRSAGYTNCSVVEDQTAPNGDFPGLAKPNPGESKALEDAVTLATEQGADLVIGTDPDCDRAGISVRTQQGEYVHLTGNQVGALLTDFTLSTRQTEGRLPQNGIVFKTIVTSALAQEIATSYGIAVENTLTGFKYIGRGITHYEQTGEHTFLIGFEESYGYLLSDIVRDKDAVQACVAIADMAAFYKSRGQTLQDALNLLFHRFGFYEEVQLGVDLEEEDTDKQIEKVMSNLREHPPQVDGLTLEAVEDYLSGVRTQFQEPGQSAKGQSTEHLSLPKSNVVKYLYTDGSWLAVRPSGTEPKIKAYVGARADTEPDCQTKAERLKSAIQRHLNTPVPT